MVYKFLPLGIEHLTPDHFQISDGQAKYSKDFEGIRTLILEHIVVAYHELKNNEKWKSVSAETDFSDLVVEQLQQYTLFVYNIFIVNREPQEGLYVNKGYLDIKINIATDRRYFAFECKKLDAKTGISSLQQKYIDEGLARYIAGKYAKEVDFGGMLGFVVAGNVANIINDMKKKVKIYCFVHTHAHLLNILCNNCSTSFQSKHERENNLGNIHIYHLFLNFIK